jgi:hypothetical protein
MATKVSKKNYQKIESVGLDIQLEVEKIKIYKSIGNDEVCDYYLVDTYNETYKFYKLLATEYNEITELYKVRNYNIKTFRLLLNTISNIINKAERKFRHSNI